MMEEGFAEHHFIRLITLEPRGIFGSKFACFFVLFYHCPATGMPNVDSS